MPRPHEEQMVKLAGDMLQSVSASLGLAEEMHDLVCQYSTSYARRRQAQETASLLRRARHCAIVLNEHIQKDIAAADVKAVRGQSKKTDEDDGEES